ncbi:hypothetical protein [Demequina activiva]|uniref:Uncharacterized protein n=1 Tax=Demequina activiva TaxID=1582364 RepID=A0A919UJL5_9MICO|nr:hypothetical protein [Demequina activiva]GIG53920.1 hypothetical protein Dac01nite_06720 [Demequina activiva]
MAQLTIGRRDAVDYVALPVATTMDAIPDAVGAGFAQLDAYVEQRGIDVTGASLIRYREVSFEDPFVVEVALVLAATPAVPQVREPFLLDTLPGGHFAIAEQRGPYAWIGGLTRELMDWGQARGLDYALERGDAGSDAWQCWYELYPEPAVDGAQGLEGPVEVGLLLRA